MNKKEMVQFKISLPFTDGEVSCAECKLFAPSCVGNPICRLSGMAVNPNERKVAFGCPLKPA